MLFFVALVALGVFLSAAFSRGNIDGVPPAAIAPRAKNEHPMPSVARSCADALHVPNVAAHCADVLRACASCPAPSEVEAGPYEDRYGARGRADRWSGGGGECTHRGLHGVPRAEIEMQPEGQSLLAS